MVPSPTSPSSLIPTSGRKSAAKPISVPRNRAAKNPRCFYQQQRKRLLTADVVVMNHTLFFLNLGGLREAEENETGYLFANDFVIFDEAHTIEQVASRQIGLSVSQYGLRYALQRLYNPKTQKGMMQVLPPARRCPGGELTFSRRWIRFSKA
jgi:Rad3-related DNA helicase